MLPPVSIPPEALRPRRLWYWVGGGLIASGCLAGLAAFVFGLIGAVGLPAFAVRFAGTDEAVSFRADRVNGDGKTWLLYADTPLASDEECTLEGADPAAAVEPSTYTHNAWNSGEEWYLVGELEMGRPGEYTIDCRSERTTVYAVGYGDSGLRLARNIGVTMVATFAFPLAGVGSGVAVLIVTAVRRDRHKNRLSREAWQAYGTPVPPG